MPGAGHVSHFTGHKMPEAGHNVYMVSHHWSHDAWGIGGEVSVTVTDRCLAPGMM